MLLPDRLLRALDKASHKTKYVRITALNLDETPRESIEGRVTGGNINVDGKSACRRSCSLSMVALQNDAIITDEYWSFKNKFKVEIGVNNDIDPNYDSIIWFNQGIFGITSFSTSRSLNNLTVSISGKDKMAYLDGSLGGALPMEVNFGVIDTISEDGSITTSEKVPLYTIIVQALKDYGHEQYSNIIIEDLDINGYELWEWRGTEPMYMLREVETGIIRSIIFDGNRKINNIPLNAIDQYYSPGAFEPDYNKYATVVKLNNKKYYVIKVEYGQTAGYHPIELVYTEKDLIVGAGEAITSLLDKISKMLGNYEYFYNIEGKFHFRKKKTYVQELFASSEGLPTVCTTPYSYKFEDEELFTSINSTPQIANVKNDYSVWGEKDNKMAIHVRYAIDKKPAKYVSVKDSKIYSSNEYDWRELIYQMASDYLWAKSGRRTERDDGTSFNYLLELAQKNSWATDGRTGYEPYYQDIVGYWRTLYDPNGNEEDYYQKGEYKYWSKMINESPESLVFWFDFLDTQGELENYSASKIGNRLKVNASSGAKSIYYRATPEVLFVLSDDTVKGDTSYSRFQISNTNREMFELSSQGSSAIDIVNDLVSNNLCQAESITITSIPIYYLEPNTRIYIKDKGDYTLDSFSYSLGYNATMNITANKINRQFIKEVV